MMGLGDDGQEGGNAEPETEDALDAEEQLTLADEDEALPWLESDEDYEEEGNDYRILIFGVLAVLLLAAILFGAYSLLGNRSSGDDAADGSTIAADELPYKSRPEDPGGSEVAGTGDVSFEVGQGQGREGQLSDDAATPSIDVGQDASESSSDSAATTSGVGVQIGAFSSRQSASNGWNQLRGRYTALQGLSHRIVEGTADSGSIFRLQAIASDEAAADAACRSIRAAGGDCQVKR